MQTKNNYNSDYETRDKILFTNPSNRYDIKYFTDINGGTLQYLIEHKYIHDNDPVQNGNLYVSDLVEFMLKYPTNTFAHGYIISINREDYRTSLEGLIVKAPFNDKQKADFFFAMNGCDELSQDADKLRAWWD